MLRLPTSLRTYLSLLSLILATGCAANPTWEGSTSAGRPDATSNIGTPDHFSDAAAPSPDSGTGGTEDCVSEEYVADEAVRPADIVFAVDSSGSMSGEARAVQEQLNRFAGEVLDADVDAHVVMITEGGFVRVPAPLGTDPEHYLLIPNWVGSHNALGRLLESFPMYASFLRPNAVTHFVVVTDDESNSSGPAFRTQMEGLLDHEFVFHAIASPRPRCRGAAAPGDTYYQLAADTDGVTQSICTGDWTSVFDALATAVNERASLPCSLAIPELPEDQMWDPTLVNVDYHPGSGGAIETLPFVGDAISCGARGGWHYDHPIEMTEIVLCPASCARAEADATGTLQVRVGCRTQLI